MLFRSDAFIRPGEYSGHYYSWKKRWEAVLDLGRRMVYVRNGEWSML